MLDSSDWSGRTTTHTVQSMEPTTAMCIGLYTSSNAHTYTTDKIRLVKYTKKFIAVSGKYPNECKRWCFITTQNGQQSFLSWVAQR